MSLEYDYIIAGGGSAGCVLASRLANNSKDSICLVEAGGSGKNLFIKMPAGNGFIFGNPKFDWGYHSVKQAQLNNRKIYFARGKGLGGTSIVNGMVYIRGVAQDYDNWRQMGLDGWGYSDLLPYFKYSEGSTNRQNNFHGNQGPLKVEPARNFSLLDKAFIKAAVETGHEFLDDFNANKRAGVSRIDSTTYRGVRQSSAISYLNKIPKNLKIFTNTRVVKILFNKNKAVGIQTIDGKKIYAGKEVIISQGAFGTPHLLMLSGIGDANHLMSHDVKPIIDLPGVGQNLADHLDVSIQYGSDRMDLSAARYQRMDQAALLLGRWLINGSGPGGGSLFSSMLFHSFDDPNYPELQIFMTPMNIDENLSDGKNETTSILQSLGRKLLVRGKKVAKPGVQIDINLERPKSLGRIRLNSSNPLDYPIIDPNYLNNKKDLDDLVKGVKVVKKIMKNRNIGKYLTEERGDWKNVSTDEEIISAIRKTAYTGHHPCSTAKMGMSNDIHSVVDKELKVYGVEGLRICDAAAMPSQITGNLYATVIAMAEKASDMILKIEKKPPVET